MSLLDDLRSAARNLDAQYQPTSNEIQGVLASLVHLAEHGSPFLEAAAAGVDELDKLLAPPAPPPPPANDDELRRQLSDLQAQLDARAATAQQTQVEHHAGDQSSPTPPPPDPAAPPEDAPTAAPPAPAEAEHSSGVLGNIFGHRG